MWTRAVFDCILLIFWLAYTAVFAKIKKYRKYYIFSKLREKIFSLTPMPLPIFIFFLSLNEQHSVKVCLLLRKSDLDMRKTLSQSIERKIPFNYVSKLGKKIIKIIKKANSVMCFSSQRFLFACFSLISWNTGRKTHPYGPES